MRTLICLNLIIMSAVAASPARAQAGSARPSTTPAVEITPFVAFGSNGASSIGAGVVFPMSAALGIETEIGYRRGEGGINALSSSANLLYALPRVGRVTPYLATGAGLGQYGVLLVQPDGSPGVTLARTTLVVNAGGGLKIPVDDTWDMRTDARWFKAVGRNGSEHWRVAHGISFDVGAR